MSTRDEFATARFELDLAPEAESARRARRFVERALTSWKCLELIEITVLLANELVTNSVLHARTHIRLELAKLPTGELASILRVAGDWRWSRASPTTGASRGDGRERRCGSRLRSDLCTRSQTISAAPATANTTMAT